MWRVTAQLLMPPVESAHSPGAWVEECGRLAVSETPGMVGARCSWVQDGSWWVGEGT